MEKQRKMHVALCCLEEGQNKHIRNKYVFPRGDDLKLTLCDDCVESRRQMG